jgi:hypothetical protein
MKTEAIADEFLETKSELTEAIKSFEKGRNFSLLQRLLKQENAINFFPLWQKYAPACFSTPYVANFAIIGLWEDNDQTGF